MRLTFSVFLIIFLFSASIANAGAPNPDYFIVKQDGLYGYVATSGAVAIEPQFDYAGRFFEGLAAVRAMDGNWGYINTSGSFAIAPAYGHASHFGQGLGLVEKDGKFGFVNPQGEMVIKPQFDGGGSFADGLASVLIGDKWGYIDTRGKAVIKPQFDGAEDFYEGLARICTVPEGEKCFRSDNRKFGFIDQSGEIVIPAEFDYAEHFSEGLAMANVDGMYGFIDKTGQWAIKPIYSNAGMAFFEGVANVTTKEGESVFIDTNGQIVLKAPAGYDMGEQFTNGLVMAMDQASAKWGYMDKNGEMVIPAQYDRALPFKNNVAPVMKDGKWGLVDMQGAWVAKPTYSRISP